MCPNHHTRHALIEYRHSIVAAGTAGPNPYGQPSHRASHVAGQPGSWEWPCCLPGLAGERAGDCMTDRPGPVTPKPLPHLRRDSRTEDHRGARRSVAGCASTRTRAGHRKAATGLALQRRHDRGRRGRRRDRCLETGRRGGAEEPEKGLRAGTSRAEHRRLPRASRTATPPAPTRCAPEGRGLPRPLPGGADSLTGWSCAPSPRCASCPPATASPATSPATPFR